MKLYTEYHNQMTLKEKIQEAIAGVMFCIFFVSMIFLCSISDAIDQTIIEARQSAQTTQQ